MEETGHEITDKLDKELNRYIGQYAALFLLNEEIELLLHGDALRASEVDCITVSRWLERLQDIVREGLQQTTAAQHA